MQGREGENDDVTALGRWAVREHFVSGAYLWKYLSDCLQILHTTPLGGLVVPFGFPEQISKSTGPITVILHIHVL